MPLLSSRSESTKLPSVISVCFLIDIGLCLAYIINYLIGQPHWKLTSLLEINGEDSLAAWYSSVQLFCISVFAAIFAYGKITQDKRSFLLIGLPVVFLLMSIDESVKIHEWLSGVTDNLLLSRGRVETPFRRSGIWVFAIGLPFLSFFLLFMYSIRSHTSDKPSSFRKLIVGMIVFLSGAVGFELLSNFVDGGFLVLEGIFEEGLEMIGATVMLWSMYGMGIEYIADITKGDA
jgi:hypothetical protein